MEPLFFCLTISGTINTLLQKFLEFKDFCMSIFSYFVTMRVMSMVFMIPIALIVMILALRRGRRKRDGN